MSLAIFFSSFSYFFLKKVPSKAISFKEGFLLLISLSLDAITIGIFANSISFNTAISAIYVFFVIFILIIVGSLLGERIININSFTANIIAGSCLIMLAIINLF